MLLPAPLLLQKRAKGGGGGGGEMSKIPLKSKFHPTEGKAF